MTPQGAFSDEKAKEHYERMMAGGGQGAEYKGGNLNLAAYKDAPAPPRPTLDTSSLPEGPAPIGESSDPYKDGLPTDTPGPSQPAFVVKDSGKREQYASGMHRDTSEGKVDYSLVFDGPMFMRWAEHLRKGAIKYEKRNWMKAEGQPELDRYRESAARHFFQWMSGEVDEDHASAVIFNINGAEYVKGRMKS